MDTAFSSVIELCKTYMENFQWNQWVTLMLAFYQRRKCIGKVMHRHDIVNLMYELSNMARRPPDGGG